MPTLTDLITHLDDLLGPDGFDDYGPNGLQVPGSEIVETVVTAVSAQAELFELAAARGADLVVVHHGLLWNGAPLAIDRAHKRRLKLLFDADMSLAAYHLPLDAHLEHGNNALLADALGAVEKEPFAWHRGEAIGVRARLDQPLSKDDLVARVAEVTGGPPTPRPPLHFDCGPGEVRTLGIVSGAGSDHLPEAISEGLDAFITGEPSERAMAIAREGSIHYIAAGHYATETFGVRRLGELLAARFGVAHEFIDIPNPI